jgi:NAD(P)-dependent dehydrogenase (short-subunit alcohol dehydrogenase family)
MLLAGKVAIVTGAASGLGAETARLFATEGACVFLADVADDRGAVVAAQISAVGGTARYVHADVRSSPDMDAIVAAAESEHGRLDIVVANAAIMGRASFRGTETISDEDWAAVIDTNLTGAFRSFRAAIPALRRAGGGALSATSSLSGVYATVHRTAYSASKGGLNAMVRALAIELAPDMIRVNGVAAGPMPGTNLVESLGRSLGETEHPPPPLSIKSRVLRPQRDAIAEVARLHLVLCSELAAYVNGEVIVADGGFSIWNGT